MAALLTAAIGSAQGLGNASLRGKFYFVQVMATGSGAQSQEVRNTWGTITFDGNGLYQWSGKSAAGAAAPAVASGQGDYTVSAAGGVSLPRFMVQAGLSGDGKLLVGATTDPTDNTQSLWVAIRAPIVVPPFIGTYSGASLGFLTGSSSASITTFLTLSLDGAGTFTNVALVGHSSARGEKNVRQEAGGALYRVNDDGTGLAWFGLATPLLTGDHDLFVSENADYLLGCSLGAGTRDIVFATKRPASGQALDGAYWVADLALETGVYSSGWGMMATMGGRGLLAQRVLLGTRSVDYSGVNYYSVSANNTGWLATRPGSAPTNLALGPGGAGAVSAQVDAVDAIAARHGVAILAKAPVIQGAGVFLSPAGVVNAASFAPFPSPVSPGQILALYGGGLSPQTASAPRLPLGTTLSGVRVTVNGIPAPLFMVSPGQVNIQAPFGLTGNSATIRIDNNGIASQVTTPLAPTNPGVFAYPVANDSPVRGIVLHTDAQLVTTANPAYPGETVIVYLTGLGELDPPVTTGDANPIAPLAYLKDSRLSVLFGGEAAIHIWYAGGAPTYAGLYQVNVDIPYSTPESDLTPVSLATPNAFADVAEIAVRRRR